MSEHLQSEHHRAVVYTEETVPEMASKKAFEKMAPKKALEKLSIPKVSPDVLHARRGDCITFSAVGESFRLELPDVFTVSIIGSFRVPKDTNLHLVVRDKAALGVYNYTIAVEPPPDLSTGPVDPTIIIHNGEGYSNQ